MNVKNALAYNCYVSKKNYVTFKKILVPISSLDFGPFYFEAKQKRLIVVARLNRTSMDYATHDKNLCIDCDIS